MKGFTTILRKEYAEFFRTWRVWVVGGAFVLFGLIDPVVAKFTNQILSSALGDTPSNCPTPPTWTPGRSGAKTCRSSC